MEDMLLFVGAVLFKVRNGKLLKLLNVVDKNADYNKVIFNYVITSYFIF